MKLFKFFKYFWSNDYKRIRKIRFFIRSLIALLSCLDIQQSFSLWIPWREGNYLFASKRFWPIILVKDEITYLEFNLEFWIKAWRNKFLFENKIFLYRKWFYRFNQKHSDKFRKIKYFNSLEKLLIDIRHCSLITNIDESGFYPFPYKNTSQNCWYINDLIQRNKPLNSCFNWWCCFSEWKCIKINAW